jgi:hypothetical protein
MVVVISLAPSSIHFDARKVGKKKADVTRNEFV